jgi:hypothetical protein
MSVLQPAEHIWAIIHANTKSLHKRQQLEHVGFLRSCTQSFPRNNRPQKLAYSDRGLGGPSLLFRRRPLRLSVVAFQPLSLLLAGETYRSLGAASFVIFFGCLLVYLLAVSVNPTRSA